MAEQKLLSDNDIQKMLEPIVNDIKAQMDVINRNAIDAFYERPSGTYGRVPGFYSLCVQPKEIKKKRGIDLVYTYSASDVSVNSWQSPWGIEYPGDSGWAFDTGFVHGYHGGPRPDGKNSWTWEHTLKTKSPWDIIAEGIDNL